MPRNCTDSEFWRGDSRGLRHYSAVVVVDPQHYSPPAIASRHGKASGRDARPGTCFHCTRHTWETATGTSAIAMDFFRAQLTRGGSFRWWPWTPCTTVGACLLSSSPGPNQLCLSAKGPERERAELAFFDALVLLVLHRWAFYWASINHVDEFHENWTEDDINTVRKST